MVIGIHQEDERVCGVATKRSNLDIGVVILKRTPDGSVSLERMKELAFERQIELEVELEPGSYIILPRTTGCSLRRPADAREENIKLLRSTGQLHEQAESTIKDIFRKFDMLLNRELSFVEFKGFFECINKQLTEKEFKMNILDKYASTERGITCHGFLEFWKNSIRTLGEETVFSWLELLGYDRDLFSVRSRCFILTMHW
jgi:calpain-15